MTKPRSLFSSFRVDPQPTADYQWYELLLVFKHVFSILIVHVKDVFENESF